MANLVAVQLETCHANTDGCGWYAYFDGEPDVITLRKSKSFRKQVLKAVKDNGAPLGLLNDDDFETVLDEEVPNDLSRHTGLKRWYLGGGY
jgi:hypothetical protein